MDTLDPEYKREIINPMKCDDLCEQIKIFLKQPQLSPQDRKGAGEQLIRCIVSETPFGIQNRETLLEFVESLLEKVCPSPVDTER